MQGIYIAFLSLKQLYLFLLPNMGGVTCCFAISVCCMLLVYLQCYYGMYKVRKTARIRNRYYQVSHLSQNTKWESNKITINITNKIQEVSPFPSGDHKTAMNRRKVPPWNGQYNILPEGPNRPHSAPTPPLSLFKCRLCQPGPISATFGPG